MALYHALIQLSRYKVPFIIDTPFARIDTEHRRNISNYFFSRLEGQVFILSTNEEIDAEHIDIMRDRIAATYLLENKDNQKTVVTKGRYFEVQYGI
jgi:DNA sulfur modification protein DndD